MNIVFIIGTGRCGSTLIHEMTARHEDVGFISNVDDHLPWLSLRGKWNSALFRTSVGRLTRKGSMRFAPSEAYNIIGSRVSPIYANSCRDLTGRDVTPWLEQKFRNLFLEYHKAQGKRVFIHKYTGWSRVGFFSRIFPEAKFVHIIRDGRAVANSWLHMPWWGGYRGPENWLWGNLLEPHLSEWLESERSYTSLAGIGWKILMNSYEDSTKHLMHARYLELRYEDFIGNPKEKMELIFDFIGIPWSLEYTKHFNRQEIYDNRCRAFEQDLGAGQLSELQSSLLQKLTHYKYSI